MLRGAAGAAPLGVTKEAFVEDGQKSVSLGKYGQIVIRPLTIREAMLARGIRSELTAGQWAALATSSVLDDRIAASLAEAVATLSFGVVQPFPATIKSLEWLGDTDPDSLLDLLKEYRAALPDPFRKVGRRTSTSSTQEAES